MTPADDNRTGSPTTQEYLDAARRIEGAIHDVNNRLGAIMGFAELIAIEGEDSTEIQSRVRDILECVEKSSTLLDTLADIVDDKPASAVSLDLAQLVDHVADLFHYDFKKAGIEFERTVRGKPSHFTALRGPTTRILTAIFADALDRLRTAPRRVLRAEILESDRTINVVLNDSAETVPEIDAPESPLRRARDSAQLLHGGLRYDSNEGLVLTLPRDSHSDA